MGGGGWTVYGGYEAGKDDPSVVGNIKITNNHITTVIHPKGGWYGPFTSTDGPAVTMSGNVWHDGPNAGQTVD